MSLNFFSFEREDIFEEKLIASLTQKLKRFRYFPEKCSLFSGYIFQHFFRNENGKSSERQWLPTLYLYITTVVINEKKRSFDALCIEIIVNVQN